MVNLSRNGPFIKKTLQHQENPAALRAEFAEVETGLSNLASVLQ